MGSYKHFRTFLITGNKTEDDISTQLLSNALKYEIKSFAAFNNNTVTDTDNNYSDKSFLPDIVQQDISECNKVENTNLFE